MDHERRRYEVLCLLGLYAVRLCFVDGIAEISATITIAVRPILKRSVLRQLSRKRGLQL